MAFWQQYYEQILSTFILIAVLAVTRLILQRIVNYTKGILRENKRRLSVNINSFLTFVGVILIAVIWIQELQSIALSLIAIAVALVLATKELIMCLSGTFFKTSAKMFHIGDRIEVSGMRGDVVDRGFFATKILEIGPDKKTHQYTGRLVTIPNSLFLQEPCINESFLEEYVLHPFSIPVSSLINFKAAENVILEIADEVCKDYLGEAQKHIDLLQRKAHLETIDVSPRVHLKATSFKEVQLIVRIPVLARLKGKTEQEIVKRFLYRDSEWREPGVKGPASK
ncbi:MAG: mechanosensitive ion channel family protein [Bacteriovoracaceae bacterium]